MEIDYTTWRRGRKTDRGNTIGYCPKCGLKGEIRHIRANGNHAPFMSVIHKKHLVMGIMWHVDSACHITENQEITP